MGYNLKYEWDFGDYNFDWEKKISPIINLLNIMGSMH